MTLPSHLQQLAFHWPWRDYQARVLTAIDAHLDDNRLHIVAAPGSGKTVLGLEVMRRLGKPALVLSPTRTIRNQWLERLQDFLPPGASWPLPWVSGELDAPAFFTSITYQALHGQSRRETEELEEASVEEAGELEKAPDPSELQTVAARLREIGIGTLILDEAHHLRAEWWKALSKLVEALPGLTVVSLTATPPYDVSGYEWDRYHELCGPIDEEIAVPELVRSGTLCPHQDFVWTVVPTKSERQHTRDYDQAVDTFRGQWLVDKGFITELASHPWCGPEPDLGEVLANAESVHALLVFLYAADQPLPGPLLKLMDLKSHAIPALDRRWWQVLIKSYLFDRHWPENEAGETRRKVMKRQLREANLLWRRELRLDQSRPIKTGLTLSSAKLDACVAVHRLERQHRGAALRQVILTDFIRDEGIDEAAAGENSLGAWPVLRRLVEAADQGSGEAEDMALLSGRLTVLHQSRLPALQALLGSEIDSNPVAALPGFVRLKGGGQHLVGSITRLISEGRLRLLVGTRALLGEGWDCPAVNSLILASFVGSYVLTNQMRGRAIRTDRQDPHKVASIWHLVALAHDTPSGFVDLRELERRFETFVGLSEHEPRIENGLKRIKLAYGDRFNISNAPFHYERSNRLMAVRLEGIGEIAGRWRQAIDGGRQGRVAPTVRAGNPPRHTGFFFNRTLGFLLFEAVSGFCADLFYSLARSRADNAADLFNVLAFAAAIAFLYTLPKLWKAGVLTMRHLPVDGTIRQMGLALRDALCASGIIDKRPAELPLNVEKHHDGSISLNLEGADFYTQSLFADAMEELLSPIDNPRYLLTRQRKRRFWQSRDYHAVPGIFGSHKDKALALHHEWVKRLGKGELIYTRAEDGRRLLLQARARAFSTAMQARNERRDQWM